MKERFFEGRLSDEIAHGDRGYRERLKTAARLLVGIIRDGLVRDGLVRIHGFGSFRLRPVKARTGVNPRTGERIAIPARQRVLFRPAKALRERVEPDRPRSQPIAEPHASREATLGTGAFEISRPWGTVPAAETEPGRHVRRGPESAAAFELQGSREAALRGGVRDPHAAGGLPPDDDESDGGRPGDSAPPGPPGAGGARLAAAAMPEPGARVFEPPAREQPRAPGDAGSPPATPAPGARTPGDAGTTGVAAADAGVGPAVPGEATDERAGTDRHGTARWGAAALLALLLALLVWWLWPGSQPQPQIAEAPAPDAEPAAPAGEGGVAEGAAAPTDGAGEGGQGAGVATGDAIAEARDMAGDARGEEDAAADAGADARGPEAPTTAGESRAADAVEAPPSAAAIAQAPATPAESAADADSGGVSPVPDATGDGAGMAGTGEQAGGSGDATATGDSRGADAAGDGPGTAAERAQGAAAAGSSEPAPASPAAATETRSAEPAPTGDMPDVASAAAPGPEAGTATEGTAVAATTAAGDGAAGAPYFRARDYTVRRGDTLWDLAARHYADPYYWPHIWNHNEGVADPDRIRVDRSLRLPALEGRPRQLSAADRRSIAEGYLRLYRLYRDRGHASPQDALVAARRFDASVIPEGLRRTAARTSIDR